MKVDINNLEIKLGSFRSEIDHLSMEDGVWGIAGPNGSGKTSLVKAIDGLIEPVNGNITVNGRNVQEMTYRERARIISYLPQEIVNPFNFRVSDVVKLSGYSGDGNDGRVAEALDMVGILNLMNREFSTLSGGEKRLVMLAGTIYQDSSLIIMDEPETFLDVKHKHILKKVVRKLTKKGKMIIVVLHDIESIISMTNCTVLMSHGKVVDTGFTSNIVNEKNLETVFGVKFIKDDSSQMIRFLEYDDDEGL